MIHIDGVIEGRQVHFVPSNNDTDFRDDRDRHRPGVIVRVWNADVGMVNLQVFADGINDQPNQASGLVWKSSVPYSEEKVPYSWHWIEGGPGAGPPRPAPTTADPATLPAS